MMMLRLGIGNIWVGLIGELFEMSKEIKLTQGKVAIVDDEDFSWLSQWKWRYNSHYAVRADYLDHKRIGDTQMHRLINDTPDGYDTDHINGDKLDNRRSNLRTATRSENNFNTPPPITNRSGFKGVWWHDGQKRWWAHIQINGKRSHLGSFTTKEEAINARKIAEETIILNQFNRRERLC